MKANAAGWDLEIAREFPASGEWRDGGPLGISCAALAQTGQPPETFYPADALSDVPLLFYSGNAMSPGEARAMADRLRELQGQGVTLVTWNGLGFDFPVLAQECQDPGYTRMLAEVALAHIDIGFAMLCDKGYMIGLNAAAKGLKLSGKLEGMAGALAPVLWNSTERVLTPTEFTAIRDLQVEPGTVKARRVCLDYVRQDAVTTLQVFETLMVDRALYWVTRTGSWVKQPWLPVIINDRLRTCAEANATALPDTSWMTFSPPSRDSAIGWALEALG